MSRKPRIRYTETDKALMWDRWQKGESPESIAQLFDRTHGSVARILRERIRTHKVRPQGEPQECGESIEPGLAVCS